MKILFGLIKFLLWAGLICLFMYTFMWIAVDAGKNEDAMCKEKFGQGWTNKKVSRAHLSPDCTEINGEGFGYL